MDKVEKTLKNLAKNGFNTEYFADSQSAVSWIATQIDDGSTVAFGGSVTVYQSGLPQILQQKGVTILDYWQVPAEERRSIFLKSLDADAYFCSANAITEEGYYLNVDGAGNRTASTIYGPRRLYIIAGTNKLVADTQAAFARTQECAPKNCIRMGLNTPCAIDSNCHDCDSQSRACRVYVLTKRPARTINTTIVLIGEDLGY